LVDLGCGSGRVAFALSQRVKIHYTGTDVVPALLDYAKSKCPKNYTFLNHRQLNVPAKDKSLDFVIAFSLFTHLLHEETFLYLEDAFRALKPSGRMILSFLEFSDPAFWDIFMKTVDRRRAAINAPLNTFIERSQIECWARHIGFSNATFHDGKSNGGVGQAVAILHK